MYGLFDVEKQPETLDELKDQWKDCKRCLHALARRNIVFWDGPEDADVMFLGQFPGRDEDRTGKVFIGKPGIVCRGAARKLAQVPEDKQFWTNVICCAPTENMKVEYLNNCFDLLEAQIRIVKPKLIVVMGNWALRRLSRELAMSKVVNNRGRVFTYSDLNIPCIIVTFPAAYNRQKTKDGQVKVLQEIKEDWEKVRKLYHGD